MQAAAATSLGHIGAITGDTSLTPLYLELLRKQDLDILVKTEIAGQSANPRIFKRIRPSKLWSVKSGTFALMNRSYKNYGKPWIGVAEKSVKAGTLGDYYYEVERFNPGITSNVAI